MHRWLLWVLSVLLLASCSIRRSDRYVLVQNPQVEQKTALVRRPRSAAFHQSFTGIGNWVGMDRHGSLVRHVLTAAGQAYPSRREGNQLILPQGSIPAPEHLYHLSSLMVLPLLVPDLRSLTPDREWRHFATTAPSGDLVEVTWISTLRTPRQRYFVARYEVTTAELRYAKHHGRWTLESAEYSEREFVQRWNRVPRR